MRNDKSILHQLDGDGKPAPRVALKGTERDAKATERYEIVGEIARGGVGIVHRGRDNDVGRDVALKVLRDEFLASPELVQRFVEEAQIGGQLQHPGIVPVYELGLRDGRAPLLRHEAREGARRSPPSLLARSGRAQPRTVARCSRTSRQVCQHGRLRPCARRDPSRPQSRPTS